VRNVASFLCVHAKLLFPLFRAGPQMEPLLALPHRDRHLMQVLGSHSDFGSLHKSWSTSLSKQDKGKAFETLVRHYLLSDPKYSIKLEDVWHSDALPDDVQRDLDFRLPEKGIDLVARTHTGDYWAIQCKFRSLTNNSATWQSIATYYGDTFAKPRPVPFVFGLVCATAERPTAYVADDSRLAFVLLDKWLSLPADFFDGLRKRLRGQPFSILPKSPRNYQQAAIRAVCESLSKGERRTKLIMPCGTGKSLLSYWISRKLDARKIVVAAPTLWLLNQTLQVWLREAVATTDAIDYTCVCSDAGRISDDDVSLLVSDLGVPAYTDPAEIASRLASCRQDRLVVFTTYKSAATLVVAAKQKGFRFDLGIFDEAHKTVGRKTGDAASLLFDKYMRIHNRLFMTATERVYRGSRDDVLCMDDRRVYGETSHAMSFKQALDARPPVLCDYRIATHLVSSDRVADIIKRNAYLRGRGSAKKPEIEADELAALIALHNVMRECRASHIVSYHSSVDRAKRFARLASDPQLARAIGGELRLQAYHVSGEMAVGERLRTIIAFSNAERALVTNARCLTEGVDAPQIDAVLFADPRQSKVDVVQAVGRALRTRPGKSLAYVILPLVVRTGQTLDTASRSSSFRRTLTTVRALASQDDRIVEEFKALADGRRRGCGVVEFTTAPADPLAVDFPRFAAALELKLWEKTGSIAWQPFAKARDFVRSLGMTSQAEWFKYSRGLHPTLGRRPPDIPSLPSDAYASDWVSWGDWLGTGTVASRDMRYRSFKKARTFVRGLGLQSKAEWEEFVAGTMPKVGHLPTDIPSNPGNTYRDKGWLGWGDWLGTGRVANQSKTYLPFRRARRFARSLRLSSSVDWFSYCRDGLPGKPELPPDIPSNAASVYNDLGWISWGDWLGTGAVANQSREFWSFRRARTFVRRLRLKSGREWIEYAAGKMKNKGLRPPQIPSNPHTVFASEGWIDIADWLGKKPYRRRKRKT
jgi:superfamily II DNA or RNA helicase